MAQEPAHGIKDQDVDFDVIVIGGGPAGSTISPLLAEKGWRVLQLEKDHHPRFHIGESLLPMNLEIFEKLGVLQQVREIGVHKPGAEFNLSSEHSVQIGASKALTYYFKDALNPSVDHAYQVRRSELDALLFRNSSAKGVDTREGIRVTDVDLGRGTCDIKTVKARDEAGVAHTWSARYIVDTSGRDTFLSRKLGLMRKHPRHSSAAIFGHFDNVTRREGADGGNISICWFEHGWFWMIPLKDGSMSVGAVCWPEYLKTRQSDLKTFLWDTIKLCPAVHERMTEATLIDDVARATGNYSYVSSRMSGPGYLLVGDAYAFVDPVFSSGVYLGMSSAVLAADVVDGSLRHPRTEAALQRRYEKRVRTAIKRFSWFIFRFTSPVMRKLFMGPRNNFSMQQAVISMLAGDVSGKRTPIALPLLMFKSVYYTYSVLHAGQTLPAWWRRVRNRRIKFTGGTTSQDPM